MDTIQNNQPQLTEAMHYRLLLERILTPHMGNQRDRKHLVEIAPGTVPAAVPFDLPMPTPHQMIGSLMMVMDREDHPSRDARIYFDTPLPSDTIFAFYTAHLIGWSENVPFAFIDMGGGFQHNREIDGEVRVYAHPRFGALTVGVIEEADKPSEVHLVWDERLPQPPRTDLPAQPSPPQIFPRLLPPAQAYTLRASSTNNLHDYQSLATIETENPMPLTAMLAHYGEQLRIAGWALHEEEIHALLAWSQWNYQTEEGKTWRGVLIVAAGVTPNRFRVSLTSECLQDGGEANQA